LLHIFHYYFYNSDQPIIDIYGHQSIDHQSSIILISNEIEVNYSIDIDSGGGYYRLSEEKKVYLKKETKTENEH